MYNVLLQQIKMLSMLLKEQHPLVSDQLDDAYSQLEMEKEDECRVQVD
jgi:hypothetical protein